ncbi:serine hydrolase [Lactiplantibacillus paraxiangfangensis]|uniref:serine hydrolase n=1 Tax=Lactiplantibacillus paraxiangfangensis TaxID=3076224 RepID=UPI0030C755F8
MKICPNCGSHNPDDVSFCENCGTKLAAAQKPCPQCQTLNPSGSRFCENCGYDFEKTAPTPSAKNPVDPKPEKPSSSADAPKATAAKATSAPSESKQPVETTRQAAPSPSRSQAAPKKARSKWQWIAGIAVLIMIVGIGAYLAYGHSETKSAPTTKRVAKTASSSAQSKQSRASSSANSQSSTSSSAQSVHFDQSQIKQDIASTVGSIGGTNSVYVSPVTSKQSVLVNNGTQSSASSIKLYILVTAYAMDKEGVLNLDHTHTVTDDEKVGGTGVIQNMDAGTKLTYREILEHMIDDSDNTAANIIIDKLGGFSLINDKIASMGATDTKLRRKMMDTDAISEGHDNTTSARDMGVTLKKIYNHQLVSKSADDEMLAILAKNQNRTKLPKLLPSEATVYNKTGEFSDYGVQNDAEIVKNSHGAFVAVVLSEDGEESDQIPAMTKLGLKLYQNILE